MLGLMMRPQVLFRWVASIGMLVVVGVSVWLAFSVSHGKSPLELQSCMTSDPAPISWICRQALYRLHPTTEEVRELNEVAGASFAVRYIEEDESRLLLKHYLDAGVDINSPDQRTKNKWTALHAVAITPDIRAVRILLEFGADPQVLDTQGNTPADLAKQANQRRPSPAYAEVITALEEASGRR